MFSQTAPLRSALARAVPVRPFHVHFWDGTTLAATEPRGQQPTFWLRSPAAVAHIVRRPGQLGLGRAYITGELDVTPEEFDDAVALLLDWTPPAIGVADTGRLALGALRAVGFTSPPKVPSIEARQRGVVHGLGRDKTAIETHYDVSHEFFALFLDRTMTYSCGVFHGGLAQTLEEAQVLKLEQVCSKLELRRGDRLLDIGCGWGALSIHAAVNHDVRVLGITLSEEQARVARERAAAAGVADLVEIRVADYRTLSDEPFDAIASLEMVEHVGHAHLGTYASALGRLSRPGGRVLIQGNWLTRCGPTGEPSPANAICQRYVFPDAELSPLSHFVRHLESAGLAVGTIDELVGDYPQTLRQWASNLDQQREAAHQLVGVEKTRVWRLYLSAACQAHLNGSISVFQTFARHPARGRLSSASSSKRRALAAPKRFLELPYGWQGTN